MESNQEVLKILKSTGAILTDGHFVGVSGRHMSTYVTKDAFLPHTEKVSRIGKLFAEKFKNKKIEIVIGPAVGGIPFSQWTAYHLSKILGKEVLSVFTEKTSDDNQVLKRGYDALVKGKRILIVEDTTTLGSSIKKVIEAVQNVGGKIVAACVMTNKDPKMVNTKTIGVPFSSLAVLPVPSYEVKDCPLCKSGVPINTQLGHGKKFLAGKN
jgi:orotate phosphoribosyltransferase